MEIRSASRLRAGVAKVDISPPIGVGMAGYPDRPLSMGSEGNATPLYARALVLDDGHTSLGLVATDLVWFYSDQVVEDAKRKWGLDHVVLLASHIHCGPATRRERAEAARTSRWLDQTEKSVVDLLGEAMKTSFPARIGAGKTTMKNEYFAYNRRRLEDDGNVSMWWANPDRKSNGPTDDTVRVFRIDDETGHPRVIMVHYACHPVILGGENLLVSSGFPGAMVDHVEREFGDGVTAMFVQGAGGDVHPYERGVHGDYGHDLVRRTGVSLAETVLPAARGIQTLEMEGRLAVRERLLDIPLRNEPQKSVDVGVLTAVFDQRIALAAISGEPFVRLQLEFNEKSPLPDSFLLGYACFGKGQTLPAYLPDEAAARTGGYGADGSPNNPLALGAGERMIDEAVRSIRSLLRDSHAD